MTTEETRSGLSISPPIDSTRAPKADSKQALRKRAEALEAERAGGMLEELATLSPEVARRSLHELRVHQIELAMQNEAFAGRRRNSKARGRAISAYMIWRQSPISRSAKKGLILEANLTAAKLLGVAYWAHPTIIG